MPIFYDSSEERYLPQDLLSNAKPCGFLESITGADLMVTPLKMPCATEMLLGKHIDSGAFFVQRKSGLDLINSFGSRLAEKISKMQCLPDANHRLLLYVGVFSDTDGYLTLNGKKLNVHYQNFSKALDFWMWRGGKVKNLPTDNHILAWLQSLEADMETFASESQKDIYPSKYFPSDAPLENDVLQLPVPVRDWRITLNTFPGIGPDRCNALQDMMYRIYGNPGTLWMALNYAVQLENEIPGWGKETKAKVRRWLGISQDTDLYFGYQLGNPVFADGSKIMELDITTQEIPHVVHSKEELHDFFVNDAKKNGYICHAFKGLDGEQKVKMDEQVSRLKAWYEQHGVLEDFVKALENGC